MGLFDFLFKSNKGEEKSEKSNYNYSSKDSYSHYKKATIDNWHDAVGISISDEFEATVCERRGYGIIVSFMHNGKEYRGLVHNSNMTHGKIKDSTDLFSDGEKVWVVVMGFDEKDYEAIADSNFQIRKNHYLFTRERIEKLAGNSIVVDVMCAMFKNLNINQ